MGALGVRIDSVPAGRSEWPLLSGGVAPDQAVEGTAAAEGTSQIRVEMHCKASSGSEFPSSIFKRGC